jgi:hypothetical protein
MKEIIAVDEQLYHDLIDCLRNRHQPTYNVIGRLMAQPELGHGLRVSDRTLESLKLVSQMWAEFRNWDKAFDPGRCDFILQTALDHYRAFLIKEVRGCDE